MKLNRSILFIILLTPFIYVQSSFAGPPYYLLDSATADYNIGNYTGAAGFYNKFLNSGYVSADVYYNLGNCYYRTNDLANSILNYERAKKLSPTDADVQFNLQLANLKTTDKIQNEPQLFLGTWWNSFVNLATERGWAYMTILLFTSALLLLLLYLFSSGVRLRQAGFWGAIFVFSFSAGSFILAREQYRTLTTHDTAIIMSPNVTVKGSPTDSGTALFLIHAGTKVTIVKTEGTWTEVKLANGNQGWLITTDIKTI